MAGRGWSLNELPAFAAVGAGDLEMGVSPVAAVVPGWSIGVGAFVLHHSEFPVDLSHFVP